MYDFIFIAGSPGAGKTTIVKLLQEKLQSPSVDFGNIREFHYSDKSTLAKELHPGSSHSCARRAITAGCLASR